MYLTGRFAPGRIIRNLTYYVINLLILYPAMLTMPAISGRKTRPLLTLPAYALMADYCLNSCIHLVPDIDERLTVGMRYLLPAIPFYVLGNAMTMTRVELRIPRVRRLRMAGTVALVIIGIIIRARRRRYLDHQARYRDLLYAKMPAGALIPCNNDVTELISPARGATPHRRLIEINVPLPIVIDIAAADDAYLAYLVNPGKISEIAQTTFTALLGRYRQRALIAAKHEPCLIRDYRLTPGPHPTAPGRTLPRPTATERG